MSDTESSATEGVEPVPDRLLEPTTLAQKQANGGWKRTSNTSDGKGGPGKNLGGTR